MSADVVGVHGIGNWDRAAPADAAANLARKWGRDLTHESVAVAYYAHHLRLYHQGPDDDLDQLDATLEGRPGVLLAEWMRQLGWREEGAQGRALAPIKQMAAWFVQGYGLDNKTVDKFLGAFLREVLLYLDPFDHTRRQAARIEIASAISAHQPRIVIAHSLGSVAAYETLWAYPALVVDLLITVGSPLAMPELIHPVLQPTPIEGMGRRPPGVRRWINIADPADLVAIPASLGEHFHQIDEDLAVPAGPLFTHRVAAYLSSKTLREIIYHHL